MDPEKIYYIPARFRRVENMHILLWLIKDACWAMDLKWMALFMIIPTGNRGFDDHMADQAYCF
jgi:hypothetical protein